MPTAPHQAKPSDAAGPPAMPTAPAAVVPTESFGAPPAMPTAPAAVIPDSFGAPPAMPTAPFGAAASPKTNPGPPEIPSGAITTPATIQVRPGDSFAGAPSTLPPTMPPLAQSAPIMATVRVGDSMPIMATMRAGESLPGIPVMPDFGEPPELPIARYEIGLEIARGGMGRVVEASDTRLGRTVALKEALSVDEDSLLRFEREIRITARLEHPSIVPVHDAGTGVGGAPFYVMRKVEGKPLEKLVAETATLPERLALIPHIVASANAIAHAHERGIVHRDIKPSNILVGDLGETIVIDWGLAKVIGEADDRAVGVLPPPRLSRPPVDDTDTIKTRAGIVYGTPGFMAPEQLRGAPADERCDVYALGATLYHLLLRKPPHHAKTADEMMRAAVDGQAKSLVEQIEGVPPDLSTIVDKSLAHDANQRYQNARELAADLERFLKGQLIAAHHYTRGDKLKRFVRKHRVPIVGIGIAVVAAIVVGVISIVNVIHERDRADEASVEARREQQIAVVARAEAEEHADRLTLANARSLLETNPTLAVAMIKRLAQTPRWQDVRAIASGARFAGVAWRAEASTATTSVQLSKDGHRALTAGNDGAIRMYDLAAHSVAKLADVHAPLRVRFADDEKRIVLFGGKQLITLDAAGGSRREIAVPAAVRDLETIGNVAYFVDDAGSMFQLDLASSQPLQLAIDEGVQELAISPDGRWIAMRGTAHLLLYDRTTPATPPREVFFGKTRQMSWSADSVHVVAQVDASIVAVDVTMTPEPGITHKVFVGDRYSAVFANDRIYSLGPLGISTAQSREKLDPRKQFAAQDLGLHLARQDTVLGTSANAVYALSEDGDHILFAPVPQLESIAASPSSPYVVATSEGSLLAWNLDEIQGKRLVNDAISAYFTGPDRVIMAFDSAPAQWLDLATQQATQLETTAALRRVSGSPSGKLAVLIDVSHHAHLVGSTVADLEGQVDDAHFVDETHLLLAVPGGKIELHDLATRQRISLVQHTAKLVSMTWNHADKPSVAVGFDDGFLWRANLTTTASATLQLDKKLKSQLQIDDDGAVWFGVDTELRAWREGGTTAVAVATVPKPIVELGLHAGRAIVFTDDGSSYAVDTAKGSSETLFPLGKRAAMAERAGLVATTRGAMLDLIDPMVGRRWTIASANDGTFGQVQISSDGRRVLAFTHAHLIAWALDLPTTPEATAKWLDAMTNANDKGAGELVWK